MGQANGSTKGRKWKQISEIERYKLEGHLEAKMNPGEIAKLMGRDRRTIEREIKRGTVKQLDYHLREMHVYKADAGQRVKRENATNKGRGLKIGNDHALAAHIEKMIKEKKWSPDVILGRLREEGKDPGICTKTLYNYIDAGLFLGITNNDLWAKKTVKKRGYKRIRTVALNNLKGKSIEERPEEANNRSEAGHWEIDLVIGKAGTKPAIITLVDRKTRKSMYIWVKNKTQKEVLRAIERRKRQSSGDFRKVFKSITADNGSEFLDFAGLKKATGCKEVYYAHPYSSWERGTNENGNRMLRRFVPKGMDLTALTRESLQEYEDWVNHYPRRIFGYKSAYEMAMAA